MISPTAANLRLKSRDRKLCWTSPQKPLIKPPQFWGILTTNARRRLHASSESRSRPKTNSKQIVVDSKSIVDDPKQIVDNPKQIVSDPKQIVHDPKPIIDNPKLIVDGPKPSVDNPKQIVSDPKQIVDDSKQVVGGPKQIVKIGYLGKSLMCGELSWVTTNRQRVKTNRQ
jgi:hypothetical protein